MMGEHRYLRARIEALTCLLLAALFAWLFYTRYRSFRDCMAEAASSCITPAGDNLVQDGALWGVPAAIFLGLASFRLGRAWWLERRGPQSADRARGPR